MREFDGYLKDELVYDRYGAKLSPFKNTVGYNIGGVKVIRDLATNRYMFIPETAGDERAIRTLMDYLNDVGIDKPFSSFDQVDAAIESFRAHYYCEWYKDEPDIHPDEIMVLLNGVTEE